MNFTEWSNRWINKTMTKTKMVNLKQDYAVGKMKNSNLENIILNITFIFKNIKH